MLRLNFNITMYLFLHIFQWYNTHQMRSDGIDTVLNHNELLRNIFTYTHLSAYTHKHYINDMC